MTEQHLQPLRIARSATRTLKDGSREKRPLSQWRHLGAYVLLGDPGAGKTFAFEDEYLSTGSAFVRARDIRVTDLPIGVDLFVDGLDEVRAGSTDSRAPFEVIRQWLHDRGRPRFRISCREADWHGNDADALKQVALGGEVVELHLDPLTDEEVGQIVTSRSEIQDPTSFLDKVEKAGLSALLRNPLLLDLLIQTAAAGAMPQTREGLYQAACRKMATEYNREHQPSKLNRAGSIDELLQDAGLLCALLLLSGRRGVANREGLQDGINLSDIPRSLRMPLAEAACRSKLFAADGDLWVPRHRSIAEFLGGRALAQLIKKGLPAGRVMAMMQGSDGRPVEPLRGLWAWLAVHDQSTLARLFKLDPLGIVLNGDVSAFTALQRIELLQCLRNAFQEDPWLSKDVWVKHPFGPLATQENAAALESLLRATERDLGYLSFMHCVFCALRYGEAITSLTEALVPWILDGDIPTGLRVAAYRAWKSCGGFDVALALQWIESIRAGAIVDADDELCGVLLEDLYPQYLHPERVVLHWHEPKDERLFGAYSKFWDYTIWENTKHGFDVLIEAWLQEFPLIKQSHDSYMGVKTRDRLLQEAVSRHGDEVDDYTLYRWLAIEIDSYGIRRSESRESRIAPWLSDRPLRIKAVYRLGLLNTHSDNDGHWSIWSARERLYGAKLPADWFVWLLEQASLALSAECTHHCFSEAARFALHPQPGFEGPSMEQVEAWVEEHGVRWPEAKEWLQTVWSIPIDSWIAKEYRRNAREQSRRADQINQRKSEIAPHISQLLDGTAPPRLLMHVAIAYDRGFSDIRGETPLQRVRDLLVTDDDIAAAVIAAFPLVLNRSDLPGTDEVLALEKERRRSYLQPAALLAATLTTGKDRHAFRKWSRPLAERLWAYYLCDGTGNAPEWFELLAQERAEWMAPILLKYATPKLKRKGKEPEHISGLWNFTQQGREGLARLTLPNLLESVPYKASTQMRDVLNGALLAALPVLPHSQAGILIRERLKRTLDPGQRIAWLVADLPFRAEAAEELAVLVGTRKKRAMQLSAALRRQQVLSRVIQSLAPHALLHLIMVLAPNSKAQVHQDGFVSEHDELHNIVRGLLNSLSNNPSYEARGALLTLADASALHAWRDEVKFRLRIQLQNAREGGFRIAEPEEAALTLANLAPAHPADMRALVTQHLKDLEGELRGLDTFQLKEFWRQPGKKRVPKIENDCRDLLLVRLRERLRVLNVEVTREPSAAQDKRPDMRVEYMRNGRSIRLPIEVKKEDNEHVWTAWHNQLLRLYTNDPSAQGFGLYLVLWFGHAPRSGPEGTKPVSAADLHERINECIPAEERHRLAVHVMDLSWPA